VPGGNTAVRRQRSHWTVHHYSTTNERLRISSSTLPLAPGSHARRSFRRGSRFPWLTAPRCASTARRPATRRPYASLGRLAPPRHAARGHGARRAPPHIPARTGCRPSPARQASLRSGRKKCTGRRGAEIVRPFSSTERPLYLPASVTRFPTGLQHRIGCRVGHLVETAIAVELASRPDLLGRPEVLPAASQLLAPGEDL